jgi:cytochrome P450
MWAHRFPEFTASAHRRYGPTFTARIGGLPASVVTIDRDVVRRLFTGDPSQKRHANDLLKEFLGERSVLLLEPDEHIARRKLLTPPFHGERVRGYARLMERLVAAELDRWQAGQEVTVLPIAQRLTLDVILQAVLGVSDASMRDRLRAIFDSMIDLPGTAVLLYYPIVKGRSLVNPIARLYYRKADEVDRMLNAQIASTRSDPNLADREDILALLVQARDDNGGGLTDTDLRHELTTLITAGHETTATAIAWGAELLAHHPEVRDRAREEIAAGEDRYLDALVKEVLRIRSPVPVGGARHPVQPFAIDKWVVAPDEAIIVNAHGIHNDPEIYPEPERFRPERFLESTPDYSFLTFGGGAHRCIGAALAQLEMRVVLGAILERFDLQPTAAAMSPAVRRAVTLVPKGGARVRITDVPRRASVESAAPPAAMTI